LGAQNIAQTAIVCVVASDITAERVAESYRMSDNSQTMPTKWRVCDYCGGDGVRTVEWSTHGEATCGTCRGTGRVQGESMGRIKDLHATIYNGGDEAVSAVERMGKDWREQLEQAASEIERLLERNDLEKMSSCEAVHLMIDYASRYGYLLGGLEMVAGGHATAAKVLESYNAKYERPSPDAACPTP
jgi:hypothetical protein